MTQPSVDIPRQSPRSLLFQFVLFPLGIALIAVGVFYLFGKMATQEQSVSDYLNQIRSGSSHERWQAAYQLSKSLDRGEAAKTPNLEPRVASLYQSSKSDDPRIRRYLSIVLGRLHDRRATPLLLDGLNDRDVENRVYAILALGELRDPAAVPALAGLAADSEKDVRKTAVYALGEIGDSRAAPALAQALNDKEPDVRWNAAVSLASFGDRRAVGPLKEMLDRERLAKITAMREDQKEDAMIVAMTAYTRLVGKDASPDLQRIADADPSLRVRAAAKSALVAIR
jgi:HEAT repeat protein